MLIGADKKFYKGKYLEFSYLKLNLSISLFFTALLEIFRHLEMEFLTSILLISTPSKRQILSKLVEMTPPGHWSLLILVFRRTLTSIAGFEIFRLNAHPTLTGDTPRLQR